MNISKGYSCLVLLSLSLIIGCQTQDYVQPQVRDASSLFARLEMNHKAIMLSIHEPYDTVQLTARPFNVFDDVLPHDTPVTFNAIADIDGKIQVDSTGFVKALGETNQIAIEASLTIDGIRFTDTAFIMIRADNPVRKVGKIEATYSGDSTWVWGGFGFTFDMIGSFSVWDASGASIPISQRLIEYRVPPNRNMFSGRPRTTDYIDLYPLNVEYESLGELVIKGALYAYGTYHEDSLTISWVEPNAAVVAVGRVAPRDREETIVFYPGDITLPVGSTVIFVNGAPVGEVPLGADWTNFDGFPRLRTKDFSGSRLEWVDSVDIVFDNLDGVGPGNPIRLLGSTGYWLTGSPAELFESDGESGDIALFSKTYCAENFVVGGDMFCGGLIRDERRPDRFIDRGYRSRRFDKVGVYRFHSTRYPEVKGTITITEYDPDDPRYGR